MGEHRVPDASPSAHLRRLVAQGMVLAWGFNPQEAARSFDGARRIAPDCAAGMSAGPRHCPAPLRRPRLPCIKTATSPSNTSGS